MPASRKIREEGSEEAPCSGGMAGRGRGGVVGLPNAVPAEELSAPRGSRGQKGRGVCSPGPTPGLMATAVGRVGLVRGQPCVGAPGSVGEPEGDAGDAVRADRSGEGTSE